MSYRESNQKHMYEIEQVFLLNVTLFFSDYEIVYRDEYDGLSMYDVTQMRRTTLVPNTTYSNLNAAAYAISPDKKFIYLAHDSHKVKKNLFFITMLTTQYVARVLLGLRLV